MWNGGNHLIVDIEMKKKLSLFFLAASVCVSTAIFAADDVGGTENFWVKLRRNTENFTPKKVDAKPIDTGGVNSALSNADNFYWKGEYTHKLMDEDEMAAFKKALELGAKGENSQAQTAFSDFIKNYPQSALRKDADQALATLAK
jgi:hypothetical protein